MSVFQPKLVVIESPFRGTEYYTEEQHRLYLLHAIEDSVKRGESPYASHHYMVDVLEDDDPVQREFGIKCGFAWGRYAELICVYSDLGCSQGMKDAIAYYQSINKPIEWRKLPDRVVAAVKRFGEFSPTEDPPDENLDYISGASV